MASKENLRAIVLDMLLMEEKEVDFSHNIIKDVLDKYDYLDQTEKAFIKRLFEGCIERQIELDYIVNQVAKTKTNKMKPVIRNGIRMGVYQFLYMDSVPVSAACDETVKLVKKRGLAGLSGFANGILRTIAREKENIKYPDRTQNVVAFLSVTYSMPEWIIKRFLKEFGDKQTETILQSMINQNEITIRVDENLTPIQKTELLNRISNAGIRISQHPYLNYAYRLNHVQGLKQVPGFAEGMIQVADVSSMLVVQTAGIKKDNRILDMCSAPGGKTLHAACKLNHTGSVLARDINEYKVSKINENIERSCYKNIKTEIFDATIEDPSCKDGMDIVFLDAPCSGLGVMGKKSDLKYHVTEEGIMELATLQKKMLSVAAQYVKPGGILMYSTCTMTKEENQDNREWFLKTYDFSPARIEEELPEQLRCVTGGEGFLQLVPGIHDTDGFFLSKFKRNE